MKLEYTTGCICDSLTIDGKETVNMSKEDIKSAIKYLIDKSKDLYTLQQVLIQIVEGEGEYEDLGQCEQCGDFIDNYKLIV